MDLGALSEAADPKETEEVPEEEEEKEDLPPWLKKSKEDPEVQEEGFDKPKSATGAGPSNKGGKTDRSDVANKADPKLGRSSNRGQKKSAGGTQAPPKAGRIDRTDVANKAPSEWLKEGEENKLFEEATNICKQRHDLLGDKAVRGCIEEEMTRMMEFVRGGVGPQAAHPDSPAAANRLDDCLTVCDERYGRHTQQHPFCEQTCRQQFGKVSERRGFGEGTPADDEWSEKKDIYEMCPHEDEGGGMEIDLPMGVEMGSPEEGGNDVAALATQAMAAIHKLAAAAGVEMDTTVPAGDDEELEEISKRKDDPRNARAKEWPDRMREALKTRGLDLTERQLQHVLRKALELQKR